MKQFPPSFSKLDATVENFTICRTHTLTCFAEHNVTYYAAWIKLHLGTLPLDSFLTNNNSAPFLKGTPLRSSRVTHFKRNFRKPVFLVTNLLSVSQLILWNLITGFHFFYF